MKISKGIVKKRSKQNLKELRNQYREYTNAVRELKKEHRTNVVNTKRQHLSDLRIVHKIHRTELNELSLRFKARHLQKIIRVRRQISNVIDWKNIGKRPEHVRLAKKGYFVTDLHMHTTYSDGLMNPATVLAQAEKLKLNIAITDHDKIKGSLEALNNRGNVNVLPGIEISAKEGKHFLFYFLDENEMKRFYSKEIKNRLYRPTNELITLKKKYDTIIVWAHPKGIYPWQSHKRDFNSKAIDGMEAYNSWALSKNIKDVYRWAKKDKRFLLGASDAHQLHEIGDVVTLARARTFKTFFNRLREHDGKIIGRDTNYWRNIATYGIKYVFLKRSLANHNPVHKH